MQADAAAGVDKWLRKALAEQLGGQSVAIAVFDDDAEELRDWNDGGPERTTPL